MLLVGRHGIANLVRPHALRWRYTCQLNRAFSTAISRPSNNSSNLEKPSPTASHGQERSYAVLGGGVTGLSSAYFLTRKFPTAKVTIYESTERLGGWIDSETVEIDGGKVLFEWGPRSLRPDLGGPGQITAQLIYELGLADDIVATHRDHDAARNRFIYYPDHPVRMPAPYARTGMLLNIFRNLQTLLIEPIFKGVIGGLIAEPTVRTRPRHIEDESVGDFVRRRFGPTLANNMLSALFHGIYAGDIYNLSARALLPKLWYLETRDPEGAGVIPEIFELMFKSEQIFSKMDAKILTEGGFLKTNDEKIARFYHLLAQQSVYTFVKGIGQLTAELEHVLLQNPNVTVLKSTAVKKLEREPQSGKMIVGDGQAVTNQHDYVISSLDPNTFSAAMNTTSDQVTFPQEATESASVAVVNLYYANPNLTEPYRGFGYLIPQSIPLGQNPERALGVIFASETSGPRGPELSQEEYTTETLTSHWQTNHQDTAPGTKLTVMFGGHWWSSWTKSDMSSVNPVNMAKSLLARHLNIVDEPLYAKMKMQANAIPQYRVGHRKTMVSVHEALQRFKGRIRVAGPAWQGGVGVSDCIRRAWEIVEDLAGEPEWRPEALVENNIGAQDGGQPLRDYQEYQAKLLRETAQRLARSKEASDSITRGDDLFAGGGWKTGLEHYTKNEEWVTVARRRVK